MSVIADVSIPADHFVLGRLLEVRPDVRIQLESMIPTSQAVVPYFWVRNPDVEAVEAALRESDIVADFETVDETDTETLFRVQWNEGVDGVIEAISDTGAVVLEGEGQGDYWAFRLRFPEYESLSAFYRDIVEKDIAIELEGIHGPLENGRSSTFDLTDQQHEALLTALEGGYFAVPREITLVELAEQLGISDSAVSQRIRRGLSKVLSTTIARGPRDQ